MKDLNQDSEPDSFKVNDFYDSTEFQNNIGSDHVSYPPEEIEYSQLIGDIDLRPPQYDSLLCHKSQPPRKRDSKQ